MVFTLLRFRITWLHIRNAFSVILRGMIQLNFVKFYLSKPNCAIFFRRWVSRLQYGMFPKCILQDSQLTKKFYRIKSQEDRIKVSGRLGTQCRT